MLCVRFEESQDSFRDNQCVVSFSFIFWLNSSAMTSALNDEIEKDVLPWLRLAEDLRILKLDVEVT